MQSEEVSRADVAKMMQGLLDRQAIQDIISCYSLGQDSHQGEDSAILQQWEETFSETGTVDYSAAGVRSAPIAIWRNGCAATRTPRAA
jgi:hypothetical protein